MPDVKVDFKDVWNAVGDVGNLVASNVTYNMGERAFVVPKSLDPMDLDWSNQGGRNLAVTRRWDNKCTSTYIDLGWFGEWEFDCSPTIVRLGVSYKFGGRYGGKGLYIHDAFLWGVADSSSLGAKVNVTGSFSTTPVTVGNGVAQLEGEIHVNIKSFGMHITDAFYDIVLQGDGYCTLQPRG